MTARECEIFLDGDKQLRVNIPRLPKRRQRTIREATGRDDNSSTNFSYSLGRDGIIEGENTGKKPSLFSCSLEDVRPEVDRPTTTVQRDENNHARETVTQKAGTQPNQVQSNIDRCYKNDRTTGIATDWIYDINSFGVRPCNTPAHTNTRFAYAASALLSTVNINQDNIHEWAVLDSGATSHFLVINAPTVNKKPAQQPISASLPDGDKIHSTHTGDLDLPELPQAARFAHILPGLDKYSLISVVKLCNAGCEVAFTKYGI